MRRSIFGAFVILIAMVAWAYITLNGGNNAPKSFAQTAPMLEYEYVGGSIPDWEISQIFLQMDGENLSIKLISPRGEMFAISSPTGKIDGFQIIEMEMKNFRANELYVSSSDEQTHIRLFEEWHGNQTRVWKICITGDEIESEEKLAFRP